MAEERLIDDDKDRKYKIIKNADGEDELVIDDSSGDGDDGQDIPAFDIPDYAGDDEEAAILTPEQFAERERIRLEEERARSERIAYLLKTGNEKLAEGDFESALYAANRAEELDGGNGGVFSLKLLAVTRNFSDYTSLDDCLNAAEGVREYADVEQKLNLKTLSSSLKARISELKAQAEELYDNIKKGKEERRPYFEQKRKRASKAFTVSVLPFIVFLVLAISFCTVMFSNEYGTYLVLTIVFAALTLLSFAVLLFTGHRLWEAMRNVRLNERDSATQLGREYLAVKREKESLERIYSSFGG